MRVAKKGVDKRDRLGLHHPLCISSLPNITPRCLPSMDICKYSLALRRTLLFPPQIPPHTTWVSPFVSFLPFSRRKESQWFGGVRESGRAVPMKRSVLSTAALVEQNQIKKEESVCVRACVCCWGWGGQLSVYPANTTETHDSLAYYYKVSAPFSWTLAHLGSAEQRPEEEQRWGKRVEVAKGLSHSGGINTPTPPPLLCILTQIFGNRQTEWCETWQWDGEIGGQRGKTFQLCYHLPAVIVFSLSVHRLKFFLERLAIHCYAVARAAVSGCTVCSECDPINKGPNTPVSKIGLPSVTDVM